MRLETCFCIPLDLSKVSLKCEDIRLKIFALLQKYVTVSLLLHQINFLFSHIIHSKPAHYDFAKICYHLILSIKIQIKYVVMHFMRINSKPIHQIQSFNWRIILRLKGLESNLVALKTMDVSSFLPTLFKASCHHLPCSWVSNRI